VAEQLYGAVRAVVADGETVTDVAARFAVSRKTVHAWNGILSAAGDRHPHLAIEPLWLQPRSRTPSTICQSHLFGGADQHIALRSFGADSCSSRWHQLGHVE